LFDDNVVEDALIPIPSRRLPAPLIPRTNSKLFVDNVAECSNPNIFTQGYWSYPFSPSPVVQIGDDGDNGARTDDGGVVGRTAKIPSRIFHGGGAIDEAELLEIPAEICDE